MDATYTDPRILGTRIVYSLIQKTIRDTINEFLEVYDVNPMDAVDIRCRLLEKNIINLHIPTNTEEEEHALAWICNLRRRLKSRSSKSSV